MKHLKELGLATALALIATSAVVGSASASTLEPANTAFTLTSTNFSLAVSGGGTVACTSWQIVGKTPFPGVTTWVSVSPVTLSWANCTAFVLPATVTASAACNSGGSAATLDMMPISAVAGVLRITLGSTCNIDVSMPGISCTLTITGGQTIGNGTTGAGGIAWTNASPKSSAVINSAAVSNIHSSGGGFGCPTAGVHTGTLTGNLNVSSATNVTLTP